MLIWGLKFGVIAIPNDTDALAFAFSTIMIATGLNVPELLLSIAVINYSTVSSMWMWLSG